MGGGKRIDRKIFATKNNIASSTAIDMSKPASSRFYIWYLQNTLGWLKVPHLVALLEHGIYYSETSMRDWFHDGLKYRVDPNTLF
jgi:hypothetical protein